MRRQPRAEPSQRRAVDQTQTSRGPNWEGMAASVPSVHIQTVGTGRVALCRAQAPPTQETVTTICDMGWRGRTVRGQHSDNHGRGGGDTTCVWKAQPLKAVGRTGPGSLQQQGR